MTFQGAGPALLGAVAQTTTAGDAMALAGAAIIMTALGLLPALRTVTAPDADRPGPARDGAPPELGVLGLDSDDPVIIHALPLRPKLYRFLG